MYLFSDKSIVLLQHCIYCSLVIMQLSIGLHGGVKQMVIPRSENICGIIQKLKPQKLIIWTPLIN